METEDGADGSLASASGMRGPGMANAASGRPAGAIAMRDARGLVMLARPDDAVLAAAAAPAPLPKGYRYEEVGVDAQGVPQLPPFPDPRTVYRVVRGR